MKGSFRKIEKCRRRLFVDVVEPETVGRGIPILGGFTSKIRCGRRWARGTTPAAFRARIEVSVICNAPRNRFDTRRAPQVSAFK